MNTGTLDFIALADRLEAFIKETVSGVDAVSKYGGTLFTLKPEEKEGQFCGVFIYKQHVQLSFSKGALLNDPKGLLQGSGKLRRHINISSIKDINFDNLKTLLLEAAKI